MLEPPALAERDLRAALATGYGLAVTQLSFLPLGADSRAWTYRVDTSNATYFLKVRQGPPRAAALAVPRWLSDLGAVPTIAPLPALDGQLWMPLNGYALVVYPFVVSVTATEAGLTEAQWVELGAALRRIHTAGPPPELASLVRRETFVPEGGRLIEAVDGYLAAGDFADPITEDLARFWRAQRVQISQLNERAYTLGRRLRAAAPAVVVCHADLHTWNIVLTPDGAWRLVDWDEVVLAPKERDLMFVVGGISARLVSPPQTARFLEGYGPAAIDPVALAFYRYAWAVGDLGAYGESACLRPDLGPDTRRAAVETLKGLFAPGEIVDLALASSY